MGFDVGGRTRGLRRLVVVSSILIVAMPTVLADDAPPPFAGITLIEAIERLQTQGLNILYSSDLIRSEMRVLIEPESEDPRTTLDAILAPYGLEAEPGFGDLLVIAIGSRGEIRGVVRDQRTGKPLAQVRLVLHPVGVEVDSDREGRFRFEHVPAGSYTVEAVLAPYSPLQMAQVPVTAGATTQIRLDMSLRHSVEETVLVNARDTWPQRYGPTPSDTLDQESIQRTPRITDDVMRVVEPLPSAVGRDESAALNVRGGAEDETLILLDGLELYDPFHLKDFGSFLSIIDSRTAGSVAVFSDAFPAEYGGRMSAVIDMDSLDPGDELRTTLSVSTRDTHVLNGGDYRGRRGQWLISARRGFPSETESLERHAVDSDFNPSYSDLFAKTSYRIGPKSAIGLHFLGTRNRVDGPGLDANGESEPFNSTSSDQYVWLRLDNAWSPHLFSRTSVSMGDLDYDREGAEHDFVVNDRRSTELFGLRQDWILEEGRHLLKWGLDFKKLRAFYQYQSAVLDPPATDPPASIQRASTQSPDGTEIGLFLADRIRLPAGLDVELGLRWDRQSYVAGGDDYASPRIHLTYSPNDRSAVRLAWGHLYQPQRINRLQIEDGVEQFHPAQRAEQLSLRFERLVTNQVRLRFSVYRKRMSGLHPRFENLFNPLQAFPESAADRVRIAPDRAEVRGAELLVRADPVRGLGWWATYTLSSAVDEIGGEEVPRSWDQRHTAGFGLSYRTEAWLVALTASYHSGRPTTPVTAEAIVQPDGSVAFSPIVGPRNSARLPSYDRADMRISRILRMRGTELEVYLNVANVYNSRNVCCIESFDFSLRPDGSIAVSQQDIAPQPRELSTGLRWTF